MIISHYLFTRNFSVEISLRIELDKEPSLEKLVDIHFYLNNGQVGRSYYSLHQNLIDSMKYIRRLKGKLLFLFKYDRCDTSV